MARARGIDSIIPDINSNLESDLNRFVKAVLIDLSTKKNSPVDTGFFASSWTAGTQRPRPDQPRENFAPWSNIKPTRKGNQNNPNAKIEPRFINEIAYNFKPFSKVYIGNRSEYAARALASPRKQGSIPGYIQGKLAPKIKQLFTDKKPRIAIAETGLQGGQGGIGQFADPKKAFADYTDL